MLLLVRLLTVMTKEEIMYDHFYQYCTDNYWPGFVIPHLSPHTLLEKVRYHRRILSQNSSFFSFKVRRNDIKGRKEEIETPLRPQTDPVVERGWQISAEILCCCNDQRDQAEVGEASHSTCPVQPLHPPPSHPDITASSTCNYWARYFVQQIWCKGPA